MQRVLFTWELGANFGHLARLIPIAQEQRALCREVLFAVNNINLAKRLLDPIGIECVLAPKITYKMHRRIAANHAELLLNCGYINQEGLQQAVGEWLELFNHYQPNLLVIDHSPTALLANKVSKIGVMQLGTGFEIPPFDHWPDFYSSTTLQPINNENEPESQTRLLNNMNNAVQKNGGNLLQSHLDLYKGTYNLLATFKELDHYSSRKQANYIGPIYRMDVGKQVIWNNIRSKKIVIYVSPNLAGLNQMMFALAKLDIEVIAIIPNLTEEAKRLFEKSNIRVYTEVVALKKLISEADLLITHSGFATVSDSLRQGIPVMVVPGTLEQQILGQRVQSLGAGLMLGTQRQQSHFSEMIIRLLDDISFKAKATQFAKIYEHWQPEHPIKKTTSFINSLLLSNNYQLFKKASNKN